MPYATVADLQAVLGEPRLVQLTDLARPPVGLVDEAVAERALEDASAEIDGYLVGRYTLPLEPAPAVLRVHCCTLAHSRLLGSVATEVDREEAKAARKYLADVARGDVSLVAPSAVPPVAGVGAVLSNPGSKVMGRGDW